MTFVVLAVGVAFIVLAIGWLKIHPFLALILAALLVGVLSPNPLLTGKRQELSAEMDAARAELVALQAERGWTDEELAAEIENRAWEIQRRSLGDGEIKRRIAAREAAIRARAENGEIDAEERDRLLAPLAAEVEAEWMEETKDDRGQALLSVELATKEFGGTAGKIAIVIVLAAIIGQCLLESGAADVIVRRLMALLGQGLASIALLANGYILSVPVFFDTVFYLLVPLARALRMRVGKNYLLYVLAPCAGGVITHSLVPPTPGPYVMVADYFEPLGLDLGTAIGLGFLLGLIPAAAGLAFAMIANRKLDLPMRDVPGSSSEALKEIVERDDSQLPGFFVAILPVLLPVVLITGHAVLKTLVESYEYDISPSILRTSAFLGNANVALLISTFAAVWVLVRQSGLSLGALKEKLEPAVTSAGLIILITSAGGSFGKMLSRTGIGEALEQLAGGESMGAMTLVLVAWSIAAVMKVAQGSGTVAMITTSGIVAQMITGAPPCHMIYVFAAVGFGSIFLSWMNDSGFWVVCKMSGFTEKETLCTWTPLLFIISVIGLIEIVILLMLFPGA